MAKAKTTKNTNDEERRQEILDAALYCFLHFGYSKTSMDDVAKKAGISRPLIYLKFKNKEALLQGIFDSLIAIKTSNTEGILELKASKKEKLTKLMEVSLFHTWSKIAGYPMSQEFFGTCELVDSETWEKHEKQHFKVVHAILGNKLEAEVFTHAIDGLLNDIPSVNTLRKRVELLIEKFTA